MIIAIDGPAASGKSTTARRVAEELGITYLDTGAMYRAVTLAVLEQGIDIRDEAALKKLLSTLDLSLRTESGKTVITLNGRDVSERIRASDVTAHVSAVSAVPAVREAMVKLQRELGNRNDSVVEGRDIGTVVFPEADHKFYIVADYRTRAERRQKDLRQIGEERSLAELMEDLKRRDKKDSSRDHSPLKRAADAIVIDTSRLSIEEQVKIIVDKVKKGNS
ncbi:MAG: (d)CMP kinase [FCB group bacterium]|nr:(d)CMP kinase [FCB group bacterium]